MIDNYNDMLRFHYEDSVWEVVCWCKNTDWLVKDCLSGELRRVEINIFGDECEIRRPDKQSSE
jgi:hypothetical protein